MPWQLIRLGSPEETAKALAAWDRSKNKSEDMAPQQDLRWFLDGRDSDSSLYVLLYDDANGSKGTCLLRRHHRPVKVTVGEFVIYRFKVYRFELFSSPVLELEDDANVRQILDDLLSTIDDKMGRDEVLSIEALPTGSLLIEALSVPNRNRLHLQLGQPFMHQSIRFPESFADYLGQMSKRSRKSVQYSQRKLNKEFDVELFECSTPDSIDRYLDDAITISRKTYQWNLLGLGLRDREEYKATLQHWARRADLRSFILYCDGTPTAFMLGYIYRDCYYYIDVGYDPDWAKYSVGSVLQMTVIERLYELSTPPKLFDFSTGYGEHKGRFGNCEQEEVNVLVLPPNLRNRFFCSFYRFTEVSSNSMVTLLDKLGIKNRLKKIIRRSSRVKA